MSQVSLHLGFGQIPVVVFPLPVVDFVLARPHEKVELALQDPQEVQVNFPFHFLEFGLALARRSLDPFAQIRVEFRVFGVLFVLVYDIFVEVVQKRFLVQKYIVLHSV